jgi:hypothetical protein
MWMKHWTFSSQNFQDTLEKLHKHLQTLFKRVVCVERITGSHGMPDNLPPAGSCAGVGKSNMPQLGRMPAASIGAQDDNKQLVPIFGYKSSELSLSFHPHEPVHYQIRRREAITTPRESERDSERHLGILSRLVGLRALSLPILGSDNRSISSAYVMPCLPDKQSTQCCMPAT